MMMRRQFLRLCSGLLAAGTVAVGTAGGRAGADVRRIRANGLLFDVRIDGPENGRPVLLLHGFPQSADSWSVVSAALADRGFRTIAPDQRGYSPGARPADVGAYTMSAFMADAVGLADTLDLDRFDLCGFGLGAALSWIIAAALPNRVRSLMALRFPHPAAFANAVREDPEQRQAWQAIEQAMDMNAPGGVEARAAAWLVNDAAPLRQFLLDSGLPADVTERYVRRLREPGALVGALSWHQAISLDEFARVPAVTVPTLFVWSEGPALTPGTAKATARYVKGRYTERYLKDAGHFLLETAPLRLVPLLLEQLDAT